MVYEYAVQTEGGSSFDNLEQQGDRLQEALNGEEAASRFAEGWDLWQINTLHDRDIKGIILIYRRPKG